MEGLSCIGDNLSVPSSIVGEGLSLVFSSSIAGTSVKRYSGIKLYLPIVKRALNEQF